MRRRQTLRFVFATNDKNKLFVLPPKGQAALGGVGTSGCRTDPWACVTVDERAYITLFALRRSAE